MLPLRLTHGHIAYAHDIVMAALSFPIALYLRVGDGIAAYWAGPLLAHVALMTAVAATVFWSLRLYRGIWRYASLNDLLNLIRGVTIVILIFVPMVFLMTRGQELPRSVPVINWVVLLVMLGGPRFIYRVLKDRRAGTFSLTPVQQGVPVLLVGAGDSAELFIRAMQRSPAPLYRVVGMVTSGAGRVGRNIHGIDVLGTFEDLPTVIETLDRKNARPQRMILTADGLDGSVIRRLVDQADQLGMTIARMPKPTEFRDGIDDGLAVRPVAIEDLLGRPQTVLNRDGMRALIAGRRVLVTGAGGTIGSEIVRQIAALEPAAITLLDAGEFNLYSIDLELGERHPDLPRRPVLADVRDRARLDQVLHETRPELVFHAAALKHVPMVEANPVEGILTNAIGTRNLADACRAAGVAAMVQISTDKAVNPTSVMGATKRLAESYCQALDILEAQRRSNGSAQGTRLITVRFGNVLGSTGSVVPLFQRQLAAGGPLTVTHPDVIRYFMTVREAVELVLEASVLGTSGERAGEIFVLDMGEPVKIIDLARQMIRLAGRRPGVDIEIKITGLRPGEKLFEEIFHGAEQLLPTTAKGILLAAPRAADPVMLGRALDGLEETCKRGEVDASVADLRRLVPEYHPPPPSQPTTQSAAAG